MSHSPSSFAVLIVAAFASIVTAESPTIDFHRDIKPILLAHCSGCHGPDKQESDVRLDNLGDDVLENRIAAEQWHEVLNVLDSGEMPPEGEPRIPKKQLAQLTTWVRATVQSVIEARRKTDGRAVLRRLNRLEYQNTMTDLLDLQMNYVRDLPPDAVSREGFTNDGRSLRMSPLQLEYYLQTARRALDRVIVEDPAPQVYRHLFDKSNVRGWLRNVERHNRLGRQQAFLATMPQEYPEWGDFLVRVTFSAELKKDMGYPLLEVSVGYRPDTQVLFREFDLVEIIEGAEQTLEFRGRLEDFPLPVRGQGKFPGLVVRVRNRFDDGTPRPKGKGDKKRGQIYPEEPHLPSITVKQVEFRGPVFDQWPPSRHRKILFDSPQRYDDEPAYVESVLRRFMMRAYRRPATPAEVQRMVEFFESARLEFPTFEQAIRETLAFVLIQPQFLYLVEPAGEAKRPLNDWELASRLSYFLWSSMPDDQLLERAARGVLRDPESLEQQVERLLASPRSVHFVKTFTRQWLQLDVLNSVAVSEEYYPDFDKSLKEDMRRETEAFFAELLRHNMSALNFIDSDFTMLNQPLARHYGIAGVYGRAFRRVEWNDDSRRGGLLGQAGILLCNSTGSHSHPIRRAVWIRDRLLNDPPAPPPPDVPSLEDADPKFHELSVREQLEIHRDKQACANCHRNIDPWGIALEHFDAVGKFRDMVRRKKGRKFLTEPVVAEDTLPGGVKLDGIETLRKHLLNAKRDQFAESLVHRLMTYALGRKLEIIDQEAVEALTMKFAKDDYQLRDLVKSVATSTAFRTK